MSEIRKILGDHTENVGDAENLRKLEALKLLNKVDPEQTKRLEPKMFLETASILEMVS